MFTPIAGILRSHRQSIIRKCKFIYRFVRVYIYITCRISEQLYTEHNFWTDLLIRCNNVFLHRIRYCDFFLTRFVCHRSPHILKKPMMALKNLRFQSNDITPAFSQRMNNIILSTEPIKLDGHWRFNLYNSLQQGDYWYI